MKLFDTLQEGQTVVFKKTPAGSYTKAGEKYIVESKSHGQVYFRNQQTKGGTFDKAWAINLAELAA